MENDCPECRRRVEQPLKASYFHVQTEAMTNIAIKRMHERKEERRQESMAKAKSKTNAQFLKEEKARLEKEIAESEQFLENTKEVVEIRNQIRRDSLKNINKQINSRKQGSSQNTKKSTSKKSASKESPAKDVKHENQTPGTSKQKNE